MQSIFDVKNLSVLVSGSSRGIGLHVARGFLEHGAKVSLERPESISEITNARQVSIYNIFFGYGYRPYYRRGQL